jgi:hypothetical protein
VLFDQGPFIFRGKVEEEFGAVTLTVTHLDRLERSLRPRDSSPSSGPQRSSLPPAQREPSSSR